MKKYTKILLWSILVTYGLSMLLGCQRKFRPLVIEMPPNRIAIGGELDSKQSEVLYKSLRILMTRPYENHQHAHPLGVSSSLIVNAEDSTTIAIEGRNNNE